jgi:hypothetical protein
MKVSAGILYLCPQGAIHNYQVGPEGGRVLVVSPPGLKKFFHQLSEALKTGPVTWGQEDEIARRYGQEFFDKLTHWGQ